MDELVMWLREQIAAKVERAHKAIEYGSGGDGPWKVRGDHVDGAAAGIGFGFLPADVAFIVDNQPLAVLAQCEAHTAILDACGLGVTSDDAMPFGSARADLADDVVWALACAYRHRPGFREEWRPPTSPEVTT